jgi:hypothetical protein
MRRRSQPPCGRSRTPYAIPFWRSCCWGIGAESAWYIHRLASLRQYGGGITAAMELTTAGVDSAVLRVTVLGNLTQLTVTDHGRASRPICSSVGLAAWRKLQRHHGDLRRIGGDMIVTSRPGMTQVVLSAPMLPPAAAAPASAGDTA